jgi:DeoR/GlpR family transcriptional regulator of sugar metabolism
MTIYTNDLHIASILLGRNGNRVFFIGGELGALDGAAFGSDTIAMLDNYFADFAFIGVSAMSAHPWITDFTRPAANLHSMMINHSKKAVFLADKTKFNRVAPVRIANAERASLIITDQNPGEAIRQVIRELGVELTIAGS